jgi:hypothetical protein
MSQEQIEILQRALKREKQLENLQKEFLKKNLGNYF